MVANEDNLVLFGLIAGFLIYCIARCYLNLTGADTERREVKRMAGLSEPI
jgi:hypothetical protein